MMVSKCFKMLLLMICVQQYQSKTILMMTLGGTKSHKIPFYEIGRALSARGHNVTFVSGFSNENIGKVEEIVPMKVKRYIENYSNRDMLGARMKGELPIPFFDVFRYPIQVCNAFYEDESTKALMERAFDIVLLDGAFPECGLAIPFVKKIPFMYLNTVGLYTGSMAVAGNPTLYSFTPAFASNLSEDMNIIQRATNTMWHLALAGLHFLMVTTLRLSMKQYFNDLPNLYDISSNVSFILQNGNPVLTYPRPLMPNVVEVACVHCRDAKKLPSEIEDFINKNYSEGFIYVSMGSSVKTSKMPAKLRRTMIDTFKLLPYEVLWKWEDNEKALHHLPKNVKTSSWFPQQDILGHPMLKLFVTHGGLLSLFESVYHGVPVVTVPVFCDHDANAAKAVQDGYAIKLELASISSKALASTIQKMINDTSYKNSARKYQKLLLDRYIEPVDLSVYWIEYVIRHNGAYHLQTIARRYGVFEYYAMDVYVLFLLTIIGFYDSYKWFNTIKLHIKTM